LEPVKHANLNSSSSSWEKNIFDPTRYRPNVIDSAIDKVNRIRDNISQALQSSSTRRAFAVRPHQGPALSSFQPVTIEEVRMLLSAMPSKSSPLDVLTCSLLKSCSEVFAPAFARLANLSMQTGKFPARYKRAQVLPLLKKT